MLVSIIIVTYNSEQFIKEALESSRLQSYHEIELIISDDCSTDKTIEICRDWLKTHGKRFVNTKLLTSATNTGIAANCNRGLKNANGVWIKYCAGDDALKPDCIKDNMMWIDYHPEIQVLFSRIEVYKNTFKFHNLITTTPKDPFDSTFILAPTRNAESQYKMLLISDRIHFTPSVFLHRDTLLNVEGYDERFRLLEDYPLWLKLTKNGHKLYFMDKITMNYRQHSKAINNNDNTYLINPNYYKSEKIREVYTYPYLPTDIRLYQRYNWYIAQIFRLNWLNKNRKPIKFFLILFKVYMNPFRYYLWLKKNLIVNIKNNEFYI